MKQVLKNQANALEAQLLRDGAMKTSELQRKVPGLKRAVGKYKNLTDTNWISKVYKDKFVVEDGTVRLKRPGSAPASSSGGRQDNPPNSTAASSSSAPILAAPAPKAAPKKDKNFFAALKATYGNKPMTIKK